MSIKDWPGGVISKTPVTPAGSFPSSAASGVWTLDQVAYWIKQNNWPGSGFNPYFYYVSLLLTGDGTNGAQNNTFLDSSNNYTITRNGNTTQGTFSPYGNLWSNYFDGSGDYLSTTGAGFAVGTGDYTVEGWYYFGATPTNYAACFDMSGGTYKVGLFTNTDTGYLGVYSSYLNNDLTTTYTPVVGSWVHLAVVRVSGVIKLFINGTLQTNTLNDNGNYGTSSGSIYIGNNLNATTRYFNGYISNFRVNKGTALYTSNFTPSTTPLTAVSGTSLLTCQSNRFIDNSSNNFTLTVNGNTSVQRFSPFNPTAPYSTATIGGSGYFDGTGDYLLPSAPLTITTGPFTIEASLYPTTTSVVRNVLDNANWNGGSNAGYRISIDNNNKIVLGASNGTWNNFPLVIQSTTAIKPNEWTQFAIVRNSSNVISLYINGVLDASVSYSASLNLSYSNSPTARIGVAAVDGGTYDLFSGYMSDLRVSNNTAFYTSNFTPTTPLTAVTGTLFLASFTNAGIPDAAMMNDLETVGNAQVSTSVKKYGTGSLAFDGSGDYLVNSSAAASNNAFGTGDFTVEGWFYRSASATYQILFDFRKDASSDLAPMVYLVSGVPYYYTASGDRITGSGAVTNNTWFHLALCRSGTSTKLFINGTQTGSTYTDSNNYVGKASRPVIAAEGVTVGNNPFTGYIDDLRITKGYARYTSNFTPPTSALQTF